MESIIADECIPLSVVEKLRSAGFDVDMVRDICPGCMDEDILRIARDGKGYCLRQTRISASWLCGSKNGFPVSFAINCRG